MVEEGVMKSFNMAFFGLGLETSCYARGGAFRAR